MLNSLKGLLLTLRIAPRKPVTAEYPKKHLPIQDSYMGFPVLTWDSRIGEPYCTGCMVCVRMCPTNCMSALMKDNPLNKEGKSPRKKIIEAFEINYGRCILCGICEEVCAFDAITMSHQHELGSMARNGRRVDLPRLLELGKLYQDESGWRPPTEIEKEKQAALKTVQASAAAGAIPPPVVQPTSPPQAGP
ncbi:MAG: 4Fe-4S dicluster domain-containing protein [Dehalococcoidia bacterium]|nr:4Fe-4S dicluster domain-containing protein [Dehalococcoidia bacterium]